jgi:hypothetical protein
MSSSIVNAAGLLFPRDGADAVGAGLAVPLAGGSLKLSVHDRTEKFKHHTDTNVSKVHLIKKNHENYL